MSVPRPGPPRQQPSVTTRQLQQLADEAGRQQDRDLAGIAQTFLALSRNRDDRHRRASRTFGVAA